MNSNGVFALVLSLAVFGVLYHDYRIYSRVPSQSQTAAVLAQVLTQPAPISSGYDPTEADRMCPPSTPTACYFDQAITDPVCTPRDGSCLTAPPATNILNPVGMNTPLHAPQEASAVLALETCPNPPNKLKQNLTKTVCSANDISGKKVVSGHCVYDNKCHTDWVLRNGQWVRPSQYVASGGGGVPLPQQPPAPAAPSTGTNAPAAPASGIGSTPNKPGDVYTIPSASGGATPAAPAGGAGSTNTGSNLPPLNTQVTPLGPAGGTQVFNGNPNLGNPISIQPGGSPGPAGGTPLPSTVINPQPQSTFGGAPNPSPYPYPPKTPTPFPQTFSTFISNFNPLPIITGVIRITSTIISSTISQPAPQRSEVIFVEQRPHTESQVPTSALTADAASTDSASVPRAYMTINGSTVAVTPSVNKVASLLEQGLFVKVPDTSAPDSNTSGLPPISPANSTSSTPTPGASQNISSGISGSGVAPSTVTNPNAKPFTQPPNPQPQISVATSSQGEGLTSAGPVTVDLGKPTDVGKPWEFLTSTLRGNVSGDVIDASSPIIQAQAALAQTLSNYEGIRAQLQDLQDAKDAGICDKACERSYATLVLRLPIQRAAVNALNNIIDEQITRISNKSFAAGVPIVDIQKSGLPVTTPPAPADSLPPDLSGLEISSDIHAPIFMDEGSASGGNGVSGNTNAPASGNTSHDPFEKPVFVLNDPYLFTPPASGTVILDGSGTSSGFQSLSGSSTIVQNVVVAWQKLTDWASQMFVEDSTKPCSLVFSLFGMCNK